MITPPKPANESARLAALYEYNILDSIPESDYDDITRIAAEICNMPISLISIIDDDRQWFKSRIGLDPKETHRDIAFCAYAILDPEEMFVVPDSTLDERFANNPLVTGAPNVTFYAGVPLVNEDGNALGTLCVIDNKPNDLTLEQKATLMALARQVVAYLEIRKKNSQLAAQKQHLELLNKELERFSYVVAHDIKSPVGGLAMATELLRGIYEDTPNEEGSEVLQMMEESSRAIINMVDGILQHALAVNTTEFEKEAFLFSTLMEELRVLLPMRCDLNLTYDEVDFELYSSRSMLLQILANLCSNAIKYNDKDAIEIHISIARREGRYLFKVKDNGIGIRPEDQKVIFELFSTLGLRDRNNAKGTGIGLGTVKRLVNKMGGDIMVNSVPGQGSEFIFNISA